MKSNWLISVVSFSMFFACGPSANPSEREILEKYPNGNIRAKYNLVNNRLEGTKYEYYENGNLKSSEVWSDSSRNGEVFYYDEDGVLETRGEYKNDKKVGCWIEYYPDNKVKSFAEFLLLDTANPALKAYQNRYLDFKENGEVDFDVLCMYHELYPVDTMGKRLHVLQVGYVPANTHFRIIYSHHDFHDRLDTLGEEDNPVVFEHHSNSDYISGSIECYTDTIVVDGKWHYEVFSSYFDTRKPTCNLPREVTGLKKYD